MIEQSKVISTLGEIISKYNQGVRFSRQTVFQLDERQLSLDLKSIRVPSTSYIVAGLLRNKLQKRDSGAPSQNRAIAEHLRLCEEEVLNKQLCPEFFNVKRCYSLWFQHDIEENMEERISLIVDLSYRLFSRLDLNLIIEKMKLLGRDLSSLVGKFVTVKTTDSFGEARRIIGKIRSVENGSDEVLVSYYSDQNELLEDIFKVDLISVNYSYSKEFIDSLVDCLPKLEQWRFNMNHKWPNERMKEILTGVRGFLKERLSDRLSLPGAQYSLEENPIEVE